LRGLRQKAGLTTADLGVILRVDTRTVEAVEDGADPTVLSATFGRFVTAARSILTVENEGN
jgi:predicted transcriptional regulator